MRAARPIALFSLSILSACGTLLGADFDGLEERTAGSGGTAGTAGEVNGGDAGESGASQGGAGMSGAGAGGTSGASTGGTGGAIAGTGGGAGAGGGGAPGDGGCEGSPDPSTVNPDAVVKINEIHGEGGGDDYIELYNGGPGTRDLSEHTIADGKGNGFTLPEGTLLGEGEFLVILLPETVVNDGPFPCFMPCMACYHAGGWGISEDGEDVELQDGEDDVIDSTAYPSTIESGQNWGRIPDGTGSFRASAETPGLPNEAP